MAYRYIIVGSLEPAVFNAQNPNYTRISDKEAAAVAVRLRFCMSEYE